MDYLALAESALSIGCVVVTTASAVCAMTKTPDPATTWGKVYRYIEMAGLVVGRAKQLGVLPGNPAAERVGAEVVRSAGELLGKGAAVLLVGAALGLSACALPTVDVDQSRVATIEKRIVTACTSSGLFKIADGLVAAAVPAAELPIAVVNAGVEQVCADPARFANDAATIEWVVKNLAGHTAM